MAVDMLKWLTIAVCASVRRSAVEPTKMPVVSSRSIPPAAQDAYQTVGPLYIWPPHFQESYQYPECYMRERKVPYLSPVSCSEAGIIDDRGRRPWT